MIWKSQDWPTQPIQRIVRVAPSLKNPSPCDWRWLEYGDWDLYISDIYIYIYPPSNLTTIAAYNSDITTIEPRFCCCILVIPWDSSSRALEMSACQPASFKALVVKMQEDLTERATKQLQAIAAFEVQSQLVVAPGGGRINISGYIIYNIIYIVYNYSIIYIYTLYHIISIYLSIYIYIYIYILYL